MGEGAPRAVDRDVRPQSTVRAIRSFPGRTWPTPRSSSRRERWTTMSSWRRRYGSATRLLRLSANTTASVSVPGQRWSIVLPGRPVRDAGRSSLHALAPDGDVAPADRTPGEDLGPPRIRRRTCGPLVVAPNLNDPTPPGPTSTSTSRSSRREPGDRRGLHDHLAQLVGCHARLQRRAQVLRDLRRPTERDERRHRGQLAIAERESRPQVDVSVHVLDDRAAEVAEPFDRAERLLVVDLEEARPPRS